MITNVKLIPFRSDGYETCRNSRQEFAAIVTDTTYYGVLGGTIDVEGMSKMVVTERIGSTAIDYVFLVHDFCAQTLDSLYYRIYETSKTSCPVMVNYATINNNYNSPSERSLPTLPIRYFTLNCLRGVDDPYLGELLELDEINHTFIKYCSETALLPTHWDPWVNAGIKTCDFSARWKRCRWDAQHFGHDVHELIIAVPDDPYFSPTLDDIFDPTLGDEEICRVGTWSIASMCRRWGEVPRSVIVQNKVITPRRLEIDRLRIPSKLEADADYITEFDDFWLNFSSLLVSAPVSEIIFKVSIVDRQVACTVEMYTERVPVGNWVSEFQINVEQCYEKFYCLDDNDIEVVKNSADEAFIEEIDENEKRKYYVDLSIGVALTRNAARVITTEDGI